MADDEWGAGGPSTSGVPGPQAADQQTSTSPRLKEAAARAAQQEVSGRQPQLQLHLRALDSRGSTGPWCQKGWGPLL